MVNVDLFAPRSFLLCPFGFLVIGVKLLVVKHPILIDPRRARVAHGDLLVSTGYHTGRSPKDKHVVRTPLVENTIWWENNREMSPEAFDRLHADMLEHMKGKDYFVQDLFGGADPAARPKP